MSRILIIDDSAFQRKNLRKALAPDGYETLEAQNGQEGLEIIAKHPVDCVLLDIMMPDFDGLRVLEVLKEKGVATPVVMLTADIQETTRQKCLALGARAVIHKPLPADAADFRETIKEILTTRGEA